jgi:hypothetical protein
MAAVWVAAFALRLYALDPARHGFRTIRRMVPLTFRLPNSDQEIDVNLQLETFRPLLGELRDNNPALADAVELAGRGDSSRIVTLREGDDELLAIAARLVEEKHLIADPALETLATL